MSAPARKANALLLVPALESDAEDLGSAFADLWDCALDEMGAGSFLAASYPTSTDRIVERIVRSFSLADDAERFALRNARLSIKQLSYLLLVVQRLSILALRKRSVEFVRAGLLMTVMIGEHAAPTTLFALLEVLRQSALELDADVIALFAEASTLCDQSVALIVSRFIRHRSI